MDLWSRSECPAEPQAAADQCRQVWLVKWMNLDVDVDQLMGYVDQGVDLVHQTRHPTLPQAEEKILKISSLASTVTTKESWAASQPDEGLSQPSSPLSWADAHPGRLQPDEPQTVSLTTAVSAMPGKPPLQLPGAVERAAVGRFANLSLSEMYHLFGAAREHHALGQGADAVQQQRAGAPAAQPVSAGMGLSLSEVPGPVGSAKVSAPGVPEASGPLGSARLHVLDVPEAGKGSGTETVPRMVMAQGAGPAAHGHKKRKPLPHAHGTTSLSTSSFRAHTSRLIRSRKSHSA